MKIKQIIGLAIMLCVTGLGHASVTFALSLDEELRAPALPAGCEQLAAPAGNRVAYHVYAKGVQLYTWDGVSWGFVAPVANLYSDSGYHGKIGTHYGGPTWKSLSGGLVIGKREYDCSPDSNSIAWLRLRADEVDGVGLFSNTTFIQRINTSGGKAPVYPGSYDGEPASVPYTAEYVFYREVEAQP